MAFDFPAAPTEGQTYRPAGGPTYIFHAPAWQAVAPAPVAYVATADAQNRIVNPAMQHSQEQGNTLIGIGYPADQWSHTHTMTGGETVQRVATSTPNGSQYRLQLKCSTAQAGGPTAAQYAVLLQAIEGNFIADLEWGTPEAKPIVVRFGFKAPAGTYSVTLKNGLSNLSYATSFVITAGQANIDTEQIITIPGPTTGTWSQDTTLGMTLTFATACGTTYTVPLANVWTVGNYLAAPGQSNNFALVGNTVELFDVGLYADPGNTRVPPPWQLPNATDELTRCERYWHETQGYWTGVLQAASSPIYIASYKTTPRHSAPALTAVNTLNSGVFPATPGALVNRVGGVQESRAATGAASFASFGSIITVNARL